MLNKFQRVTTQLILHYAWTGYFNGLVGILCEVPKILVGKQFWVAVSKRWQGCHAGIPPSETEGHPVWDEHLSPAKWGGNLHGGTGITALVIKPKEAGEVCTQIWDLMQLGRPSREDTAGLCWMAVRYIARGLSYERLQGEEGDVLVPTVREVQTVELL